MKRNYISIYFPHINEKGKKDTKNLCVAFNDKELDLYHSMKSIPSGEIKKMIAIHSYSHLIKVSDKESRKPSELIKLRYQEQINNRIKRTIEFEPEKINKWISSLKKQNIKGINKEIISFLEGVLKKD